MRPDPRRPALVARSGSLTYGEMEALIGRRMAQLSSMGIRDGDRVAVLAANTVEGALIVHAVPRLGAVLVPLNARLSDPEIGAILEKARPRLLLVDAGQAARPLPRTGIRFEELAAVPVRKSIAPAERSPERPATILFTSGTSGEPKGAVLTWANHEAHVRASSEALGLTAEDRWLLCLPLFHVGGIEILYRCASAGAAVLLHERFTPEGANAAFDKHGATLASFVPVMLARTLEARGARPLPDSVRGVVVGGGPAPQDLIERCPQALPTYGLTEACSQVTLVRPGASAEERRSAGRPLPGMEVSIIEGEIAIRGPSVMGGYLDEPWRDPSAWFRTGDAGVLDATGCLHVAGRREDLILSGGENVYPAEIEAVLSRHAGVREAAVVGIPDPEWGERPLAALVAARGLDLAELRAELRAKLAGFKVPRLWVVDAIPRLANGKPDRVRLRREALQAPAAASEEGDSPES